MALPAAVADCALTSATRHWRWVRPASRSGSVSTTSSWQ